MSIVMQKEKLSTIITPQSDSQDYMEIFSFLEQIRSFEIPRETHSQAFTISLFDLLNKPLANRTQN